MKPWKLTVVVSALFLAALFGLLLGRKLGARSISSNPRARDILENWSRYRARFVKVFPKEYRRALAELAAKSKVAA